MVDIYRLCDHEKLDEEGHFSLHIPPDDFLYIF